MTEGDIIIGAQHYYPGNRRHIHFPDIGIRACFNTVHLMGLGNLIRNLLRGDPLTRLRAEANVVHGSPVPLRRA